MSRLQTRITAIVTLCTLTLLASCATTNDSTGSLRSDPLRPGELDESRVKRLPAEQLYRSAREALDSADYTTAIQLYDRLDALFPFTEFATQGKLEAIYAHYRSYQADLAITAADRFLRANPRHEHLDYVLYIRGLVNFDRGAADLLDLLDIDSSTRDPINARRAFEDFAQLLQRFPTSSYATDARQRMIYLRDRIAKHELAIAKYYFGRRAWVAASRRAQEIVAKFQGSMVVAEAMQILADSYTQLGLDDRAQQMRDIQLASFPPSENVAADDSVEDNNTETDSQPPSLPAEEVTSAPQTEAPAAESQEQEKPSPTVSPRRGHRRR